MTVELQNVWLSRSGRAVLRAIDWRIEAGQRWVLLGANGAGKTQLLKLLAGAIWPMPRHASQRLYEWRGEKLDEPRDVAEEIVYLGAERQDRYEHYEWNLGVRSVIGTGLYRTDIPLNPLTAADRRRIDELIRVMGIQALAARKLLTLSYGERRLVLLARALAAKPALLLLDEPLNGLDTARHSQLQQLFARASLWPSGWVLATHRPEDIPDSATHLLRLDRGRVSWQGRLTAARRRGLLAAGRRLVTRARRLPRLRSAADAKAPLLRLKNAWVWLEGRAVLRRLAFDLSPGQCWVVHGANGSGKSTLVRALYGDLGVAAQGSIRRRGIESGVPIAEFKQRVGLVAPELQTTQPLYLSSLEVVVSGLHSSIGLDERPTTGEIRLARASLRRMGATPLSARPLRELSYGQLRRVLFARALVASPELLLLDEPYTGLDAPTRQLLRTQVEELAGQGVTILLTSHHRDEWPRAVSHELQLRDGSAVYCGPVRDE